MEKEFQGKKLLVLGGIKLSCAIVQKAQEMGAYVAVADYNTDSPAKEIADEAVLLDATDVEALVEWCKTNNVDGVTTGFVDILMPVCFEVCKRLGLPYYATTKMISMSTNKQDFKMTCEQFDIPVPKTYLIGKSIPEDVYNLVQYPVFVKPLDASGSRGAGTCFNKEQLDSQFEDAVSYSSSGRAIVEDCNRGREFLLDYVGVAGEFRLLSMFDRYVCSDRSSAVNYSNVSIAPSKAINQYYAEINPKVQRMFRELGFEDGLVFLQGHFDGNSITFYEMGCRLGGSMYELEQAVLGLNPVEMIIRYALSGKMLKTIDQIPDRAADFPKAAITCNYLLDGDGETIARIDGVSEVKALDSFVALIQERDVGCYFEKDRTMDKPVLSFYMVADSVDDIRADLQYMNHVIQVTNAEGKSLLTKKLDPKSI